MAQVVPLVIDVSFIRLGPSTDPFEATGSAGWGPQSGANAPQWNPIRTPPVERSQSVDLRVRTLDDSLVVMNKANSSCFAPEMLLCRHDTPEKGNPVFHQVCDL